jgi:elongation factor Ts
VVDLFVDDRQGYIYTHPGDKVAAVVYYEWDEERAKEVALQVAAMQPSYLNRDEIPEADIQAMQEWYREEFADSGKPADIVDKIIDGKINKELSEKVLLEQISIIDDGKSVKQQLGDTQVVWFVRYAIGQ